MNADILLISLSSLLPLGSTAMAQGRPCADGSESRFVGHPFIPTACPEEIGRIQEPSPLPPAKPDKKAPKPDKKLFAPEPLFGGWSGLTVHINMRYEVYLDVFKAKRKLFHAYFMAKNYRTHYKQVLSAAARPGKRRGEYEADVRLESQPDRTLKALVRLEPVPAESPLASRFDRQASIAYEGRRAQHVVFFKLLGPDKISYLYEDRSGVGILDAAGALRSEGELVRSEQ